jgi:hypothetical protein
MVSSRGGKFGYVVRSRFAAYRDLRERGFSKKISAMIANAGKSRAGRSSMAKKASRSRKRRGGH